MSKKTLNKANLESLGAPKLSELVMELVQGSAALQRRARMELSAAQGPKEVTADLRKRFASLRRSRSYVDWRKQRALVKDLGPYQDYIADMQLTDFKVRITNGGTEAVTRVIIDNADAQGRSWSTVGVSANIVDASFDALVDAINWKLIRDGATV